MPTKKLNTTKRKKTTVRKRTAPVRTESTAAGTKLPSFVQLCKTSCNVMKQSFGTYIMIALTPFLALAITGILFMLFFVFSLLAGTTGMSVGYMILSVTSGIALIASVVSVVLFEFWSNIALIEKVKNPKLSFRQSFKASKKFLWPYLLTTTLSTLIILGGFTIFIIPGIIFSFWFFFATMVVVFEGKKGLDALIESRRTMKGYIWAVLGRLFLISAVLMIILYALDSFTGDTASFALGPFYGPFIAIFMTTIYQELRKRKGKEEYPKTRSTFKVFAGIGIVTIVGMIALCGFLLKEWAPFMNENILDDDNDSEWTVPSDTNESPFEEEDIQQEENTPGGVSLKGDNL